MANQFLTLLDLQKLRGGDPAIGLIEENMTSAPELMSLMGRTINGISWTSVKRTVRAGNGVSAFRNANEGSETVKSTYEQTVASCYFVDTQLAVDEAVVKARVSEGGELSDILALEAGGVLAERLVSIGDQFYRGTTADAKGFAGLLSLYDATNCEVSATGSSGSACSAWLVYNNPKGVHWIWGNGGGLDMGTWERTRIADAAGKPYYAYCNNLTGYIGLAFGHSRSAIRIKLITTASGKNLSDALVMQALNKAPAYMKADRRNWRLFANPTALYTLQASRVPTVGDTEVGFPTEPTVSCGVKIIETDSLPQTE